MLILMYIFSISFFFFFVISYKINSLWASNSDPLILYPLRFRSRQNPKIKPNTRDQSTVSGNFTKKAEYGGFTGELQQHFFEVSWYLFFFFFFLFFFVNRGWKGIFCQLGPYSLVRMKWNQWSEFKPYTRLFAFNFTLMLFVKAWIQLFPFTYGPTVG